MKITKQRLKDLIKEELAANEGLRVVDMKKRECVEMFCDSESSEGQWGEKPLGNCGMRASGLYDKVCASARDAGGYCLDLTPEEIVEKMLELDYDSNKEPSSIRVFKEELGAMDFKDALGMLTLLCKAPDMGQKILQGLAEEILENPASVLNILGPYREKIENTVGMSLEEAVNMLLDFKVELPFLGAISVREALKMAKGNTMVKMALKEMIPAALAAACGAADQLPLEESNKLSKRALKELIKEELQLRESASAELTESDINQMQSEILKGMVKEEMDDIMSENESEDDDQKEFDKVTKDKELQRKAREFCAKLTPAQRKRTLLCSKQFTGEE